MTEFDELPKSVKKVVRYIKYEASERKVEEIERALKRAIQYRVKNLKGK